MADIDLWDAENEPVFSEVWTTYLVKLPHNTSRKSDEMVFVYVEVDQYGLVSLDRQHTIWFGEKYSMSSHELARSIYEWLVEWEFAEWKAIGPEDSELFATEKLVGKDSYAKLDR